MGKRRYLAILVYALSVNVTASEMSETCLKQMGLSIADLPSLAHDSNPEVARKRGCLEACVMQKMGLMDGNVINTQKIDELLDNILPDGENKEIVRNNVHQCAKDAANDDQCLVAQNFAQCGLEHLKLTARQLLSTIA
ncbi:general odorant-binding protein 19d-like isoform X2 [Bombus flavifrons]|uniref:general odorant-binding protein 19d-like isoform X2 n=1 Tax=Bombus flavifrons TaxID=103934 RepID=UPI0037046EFE